MPATFIWCVIREKPFCIFSENQTLNIKIQKQRMQRRLGVERRPPSWGMESLPSSMDFPARVGALRPSKELPPATRLRPPSAPDAHKARAQAPAPATTKPCSRGNQARGRDGASIAPVGRTKAAASLSDEQSRVIASGTKVHKSATTKLRTTPSASPDSTPDCSPEPTPSATRGCADDRVDGAGRDAADAVAAAIAPAAAHVPAAAPPAPSPAYAPAYAPAATRGALPGAAVEAKTAGADSQESHERRSDSQQRREARFSKNLIVFDGWGEKYNAQCKNPAKVGRQYEECAIL